MLDLLYDLTPDECITHIEGHLLVLVLDDDRLSDAVASFIEARLSRLDDASEFRLAMCRATLFPLLKQRTQELPALLHFLEGKPISVDNGVDDCVEFFEEFVIANRCKKQQKKLA